MSYLINNQQKVNDIIFANRNKSYGAYAIRSAYGNTLLKSILIMMSGIGSVLGTAYYFANRQQAQNYVEQFVPQVYKNTVVNLAEPKNNTPKKAAAAASVPESKKTENKGATTIVDSTTMARPAVINSDIIPIAAGQGSATTAIPNPGTVTGGGGDAKKPGEATDIADPFGVDSQPEFEGGLGALYKFVSRNIKYPALASDIGKEGTVYVKFVVDEKGKIGNLKLLNNAGFGFDDEALRVISMIPDFKTPAKVNGRPVKVYYQLPIKFRFR